VEATPGLLSSGVALGSSVDQLFRFSCVKVQFSREDVRRLLGSPCAAGFLGVLCS
jgi:hypothetical protein